MTRQEFWRLMDKFRAESDMDTDIFYAAASDALAGLAPEEAKSFNMWLGAYMYAASECVWLDMACKVINGYVSDDTSLYFTLWVVAQGEEVLLKALKDPDTLADIQDIPFGMADFEMLMAVGFDPEVDFDMENSFGFDEDFDPDADFDDTFAPKNEYVTEVEAVTEYKNGDKFGNYESFEDAMADIPNHLPRLIARAAKEDFDWQGMYDL